VFFDLRCCWVYTPTTNHTLTHPPTRHLARRLSRLQDDKNWDKIFLLQPGVPDGLCTEAISGVFTRQWSAGTASLDCNTFSADLPFPSL
jgi:hypothetical protein